MLIEDVVIEYFKSLFQLDKSEALKELAGLGWKQNKITRKRFIHTPTVDSNGLLQNFQLPSKTEITHEMIGENITTAGYQ